MSLNFYLQKIVSGGALTESEAAGACELLLRQETSSAAAGGLLTALHMRGETAEEIVGFTQNLRKQVTPLEVGSVPTTDIVNLSPHGLPAVSLAAAILLAGIGVKTTKMLPRSRNITEGDLLPALGLNNLPNDSQAPKMLTDCSLCFVNIAQHVPALRNIRAHQEALGIPTVLDWALPFAHPAKVASLLLAIDEPKETTAVAQALRRIRFDRALVMAPKDGDSCPFSTPVPVVVTELRNGRIQQDEYSAADFGLNIGAPEFPGAEILSQVGWIRAFLDRRSSPITDAVRWTTSCALVASGRAENLPEALALVDEAIAADRAAISFANIVSATRRSAA